MDLARWLTQELRTKGAPLAPQSPPSDAPAAGPVGAERDALAGWLVQDLTPKNSSRQHAARLESGLGSEFSGGPSVGETSSGSRVAMGGGPLAVSGAHSPAPARASDDWSTRGKATAIGLGAVVLASSNRVSPSAAVSPAAVSPAARSSLASSGGAKASAPAVAALATAGTAVAPSDGAAALEAAFAAGAPSAEDALATSQPPSSLATLEDDDLAVLPGRRRAAPGPRRARLALALLLGMVLLGVALVMRLGAGPEEQSKASAPSGPSTDTGVLLPPPPSSDAPLPAVEVEAPPPVRRRAGAVQEEPEGLMDPRDPRFSRGGPSVRRYADVPSPTLSRLAREQRRIARERDEAVRKAKAAQP